MKTMTIIYLLAAIIGTIAGTAVFMAGMDYTPTPSDVSTPKTESPPPTIEDIKNSASPISYDEIMRNSYNQIVKIVYKRGEI